MEFFGKIVRYLRRTDSNILFFKIAQILRNLLLFFFFNFQNAEFPEYLSVIAFIFFSLSALLLKKFRKTVLEESQLNLMLQNIPIDYCPFQRYCLNSILDVLIFMVMKSAGFLNAVKAGFVNNEPVNKISGFRYIQVTV